MNKATLLPPLSWTCLDSCGLRRTHITELRTAQFRRAGLPKLVQRGGDAFRDFFDQRLVTGARNQA